MDLKDIIEIIEIIENMSEEEVIKKCMELGLYDEEEGSWWYDEDDYWNEPQ